MDEAASFMEEHLNEHRKEHINGVVKTARELAIIYGADVKKAETAAFLHDMAKYLTVAESDAEVRKYGMDDEFIGSVNLAHGRIAACWAEDRYGIKDQEILDAIRYHTSGKAGMSLLEKIVFVADTVEPGRTYDEAAMLLERSKEDLQWVYEYILKWVVGDLTKKGIKPGRDTMNAYKEITDGK